MNEFTKLFLEMNCDNKYQDYKMMLHIADMLGLDVNVRDESGNIVNHDRNMVLKNYYQTTGILFLEVYDE